MEAAAEHKESQSPDTANRKVVISSSDDDMMDDYQLKERTTVHRSILIPFFSHSPPSFFSLSPLLILLSSVRFFCAYGRVNANKFSQPFHFLRRLTSIEL